MSPDCKAVIRKVNHIYSSFTFLKRNAPNNQSSDVKQLRFGFYTFYDNNSKKMSLVPSLNVYFLVQLQKEMHNVAYMLKISLKALSHPHHNRL